MDLSSQGNNGSDYGVSVVIPCYNYAGYLADTIDSVLNQDYDNIEVIVIDDGSTDETREVALKYGNRIRYIYQDNQGLSATRNNGIKISNKHFIAFLDADDKWEPNFISVVIKQFKKLSTDVGIVACLDSKIDKAGRPLRDRVHQSKLGELTTKDLILKNRFFPGAAVVIREAFDVVGDFDTNLRSSEDRDMWIRISCRYKVWLIGDSLVKIRKHGENMSSNAERMLRNKQTVIGKCYQGNVVSRMDFPFWLTVNSIMNYQVSWIYYNQGDRLKSLYTILKSLLIWPLPLDYSQIDVPVLFRLRALVRFLLVGTRVG